MPMTEAEAEASKTAVEEQVAEGPAVHDEAPNVTTNESEAITEVAVAEPAAENVPAKPTPKLCGICDKEEGKYKCPRCALP